MIVLMNVLCVSCAVMKAVLTDVDTHSPPATAPQLTAEGPPPYPDPLSEPQTSTYPPPPTAPPQITVEGPPPYSGSINEPKYNVASTHPTIPQPLPVTTVITQPQIVVPPRRTRRPVTNGDSLLRMSVALCVICCLCGSPLTVACFIPAIYMSAKVGSVCSIMYRSMCVKVEGCKFVFPQVNKYNEYGEYDKARSASIGAYVLNLIGFLTGLVILVVAIVYEVVI